jgi:hypothetical protein
VISSNWFSLGITGISRLQFNNRDSFSS